MINYTEKGIGLHDAIQRAGHWLAEGVQGWRSSDDVAVQAIIDAYTLDQTRAPIIARIKELAREKILTFLPDWKQSNLNARMNELNEIRFTRSLSSAEEAEVTALKALWAKAKAVRQASNTHEANIAALDSFEAVLGYDIEANWPEV